MKRLRELLAQAITRMKSSAGNQGAPGRLPEVLDVIFYQIMELGLATLLVTTFSTLLPPSSPLANIGLVEAFYTLLLLGVVARFLRVFSRPSHEPQPPVIVVTLVKEE